MLESPTWFQEGGWGMWPTLFFGLGALALAARYALKPNAALSRGLIGITIATVFSGVLGTAMGFINTFKYAAKMPSNEQLPIAMIGVSESLWNIVLAMVFAVLVALIGAAGGMRRND
jgi:hypothetical protein